MSEETNPAPLQVGADAGVAAPADAAPAKTELDPALVAALQAVAVQFKAKIYGNAVEQNSPMPFAFNCDGTSAPNN